jgi:hypothetical protein
VRAVHVALGLLVVPALTLSPGRAQAQESVASVSSPPPPPCPRSAAQSYGLGRGRQDQCFNVGVTVFAIGLTTLVTSVPVSIVLPFTLDPTFAPGVDCTRRYSSIECWPGALASLVNLGVGFAVGATLMSVGDARANAIRPFLRRHLTVSVAPAPGRGAIAAVGFVF